MIEDILLTLCLLREYTDCLLSELPYEIFRMILCYSNIPAHNLCIDIVHEQQSSSSIIGIISNSGGLTLCEPHSHKINFHYKVCKKCVYCHFVDYKVKMYKKSFYWCDYDNLPQYQKDILNNPTLNDIKNDFKF